MSSDAKKKIIYIIPSLDMNEGGGILEFLYLLIKYTDLERYTVNILVFYSSNTDCLNFEKIGAEVHIASSEKEKNTYLSLFQWLTKKIKELNPQIVHTNIYWADTIGRAAAFKCKIPVVITTEHNTNLNETLPQRQIKLKLSKNTDAIVCNTHSVKHYSVNVDGIDPSKIEVIPCAFDFARYAQNLTKINGLSKKFYFVGRFVDQKKPLELIEVFKSIIDDHPECQLIGVGEGPLHQHCQSLVDSLGMSDSIFLVGYKENPFQLAEPGSILVLNSAYEGQGIVLLEAMAQGLICIAPDCGGIPEVITHEETGFLFKTNNQAALKTTIEQILCADLGDLNRIRLNAHKRTVDRFHPRKMADSYIGLYEGLLKDKLSGTK